MMLTKALAKLPQFASSPSQCWIPLMQQVEQLHISAGLQRRYRGIRGGGRPLPWDVPKPTPNKYHWKVLYPEDNKYTTEPLTVHKLGGRNEKGRVAVRTLGGGLKKYFLWIDYVRAVPEGMETLVERVEKICESPCHPSYVALVAQGEHKRWIVASQDMKVGDLITTHKEIPRIPIHPKVGDAHPLGALPVGTIVHNVETEPGRGGEFVRSSGSSAEIVRKLEGGVVIVKLPSKREVSLREACMAVVGTVYNSGCKYPLGSDIRAREIGRRPCSGWWHRKDGYCGFKNRPIPPLKEYLEPRPEEGISYTVSPDDCFSVLNYNS